MDLKKALRGDGAERFLEDLSLSVRKVIFSSFPHLTEIEREEIDQEVKLKILRMAAGGKKIGNFRSYVWKMVYSTALDVLNDRRLDLSLEEAARRSPSDSARAPLVAFLDNLTPDAVYEDGECRAHLERAVAKLPARRKAVVALHFQGLGLEETAAFLGETLPTVRHLLYRGLAELKERLASVLCPSAPPVGRLVLEPADADCVPRSSKSQVAEARSGITPATSLSSVEGQTSERAIGGPRRSNSRKVPA